MAYFHRHAGFSAHYLGAVTKFMMQQTPNKSSQAQLVEKIEQAQLDSRLLLKPTPADAVRLRLDRHGFQVWADGLIRGIFDCTT